MHRTLILLAASTLLAVGVSGCGNGSKNPEPVAEVPEPAPAVAAEPAPFDPIAAAQVMDEPMDGSSVEAFTQGLERVKTLGGADNYQILKSALSALLFYDLSLAGDKAKLYQSLDGLTPKEIVERARPEGD